VLGHCVSDDCDYLRERVSCAFSREVAQRRRLASEKAQTLIERLIQTKGGKSNKPSQL